MFTDTGRGSGYGRDAEDTEDTQPPLSAALAVSRDVRKGKSLVVKKSPPPKSHVTAAGSGQRFSARAAVHPNSICSCVASSSVDANFKTR